jgi:hypothetical protein
MDASSRRSPRVAVSLSRRFRWHTHADTDTGGDELRDAAPDRDAHAGPALR